MSGPAFGRFEADDTYFSPMYGGIDWQMAREANGPSDYEPVGFDSDDGLVIEVHQENTQIRLNRVNPDLDMISVADYRDQADYIWFRESDPKRFTKLLVELGRAALVIRTEYPLKDTVKIYLDRAETGLDIEYLDE